MDGRLDSVLTTTTTLSDFSLSNGNNDVVTPSILPSIPDVNEVVFGNDELPMHDFQKVKLKLFFAYIFLYLKYCVVKAL